MANTKKNNMYNTFTYEGMIVKSPKFWRWSIISRKFPLINFVTLWTILLAIGITGLGAQAYV